MQNNHKHILVIDDDTRLRALLEKYLAENGFLVSSAKDAETARKILQEYVFDLLILDVMMPNELGTEFLTKLREQSDVPVILLTAMGEASDKINGLEIGADDYICKPFEPKELLLRIANIFKRQQNIELQDSLNLGQCSFNLQKKELTAKNGNIIHITPVEQSLLLVLGQKFGVVFSREKLADILGAGQSPRSIDVQITRLRKKVEKDSKNPRYLQTVRGKGYVLLPE